MRLKSVKPLLPPKPVSLRKNSSMAAKVSACVMMEVHALDARAEGEVAEHEGQQPGTSTTISIWKP
jgi:hypothetical protein